MLALVGAMMLTLCAAPVIGAIVPLVPASATATMSGSTVVVTLSEPVASFPAQAVSGLTVVNGGHTIPVVSAVVAPSTPTELEITTATVVGRTASTLTSTVTYSGAGNATTSDGEALGRFTATLDTTASPAIYLGTKWDSQIDTADPRLTIQARSNQTSRRPRRSASTRSAST